jgi:hypothetical protein
MSKRYIMKKPVVIIGFSARRITVAGQPIFAVSGRKIPTVPKS